MSDTPPEEDEFELDDDELAEVVEDIAPQPILSHAQIAQMSAAEIAEVLGVGLLYKNERPLPDTQLFKNALWHPGLVE